MSKTDRGTTEILIGTDTYTLMFTLKAVKRIEKTFGGILPAMNEVQKCNINKVAALIICGAGLALKPSELDALEEDIYSTGVLRIVQELNGYLSILLNPSDMAEEQPDVSMGKPEKPAKK